MTGMETSPPEGTREAEPSLLEQIETRFCDPQRRPEYWDGFPPGSDGNHDLSAGLRVVHNIIQLHRRRLCNIGQFLGRIGYPNRFAYLQGQIPHNQGRRDEFQTMLDRSVDELLKLASQADGDPKSPLVPRIKRFLLGYPPDQEPSFFDHRFRHMDVPVRYVELPAFYRRARLFNGQNGGSRSSIVNVAGNLGFHGGGPTILPSVREELERCASAGVDIWFLAPRLPGIRGNMSLDTIENEWLKELRPDLRSRIHVVRLASTARHQVGTEKEPKTMFAIDFMGSVWRYTSVVTRAVGAQPQMSLVAIRRALGKWQMLHQAEKPMESETDRFMEWVRLFCRKGSKAPSVF